MKRRRLVELDEEVGFGGKPEMSAEQTRMEMEVRERRFEMDGGDARFELQVNCYRTMGRLVIGR